MIAKHYKRHLADNENAIENDKRHGMAFGKGDVFHRSGDDFQIYRERRHLCHGHNGHEPAAIQQWEEYGQAYDKEHEHGRKQKQRHFYLLVDGGVHGLSVGIDSRKPGEIIGLHSRGSNSG